MRFHRTPLFLQWLLPQFTWRVGSSAKTLFLTFDDGPVPEATEFVLDELGKVEVKATFFCVGDNIRKHPALAQRLVREGHRLGNHTYNHLSGWKIATDDYLANIDLCQKALEDVFGSVPKIPLFRPPYGRITFRQAARLRQAYQLVMWDLLSYDFDPSLSPERCLAKTLASTRPGSIVVFHDNVKSMEVLRYVLPRYLDQVLREGYNLRTL